MSATENTASNSGTTRKRPTGLVPFKAGQSGNPGGRPKVLQSVTDLARAHTELAILTLAEIARRKKSPGARVAAAVALLDRAWGKAVQPVESKSLTLNIHAYSDAELLAIIARASGDCGETNQDSAAPAGVVDGMGTVPGA